MKIGILSDTHNERYLARKAAEIMLSMNIKVIVHCGDVGSTRILDELSEFQIFLAYGNQDFDRLAIDQKLLQLGDNNKSGKFLQLSFAGKDLFVTHGDDCSVLNEAINSQRYDYVLSGHTHRFRDQKIAKTRDVNPGALGGRFVEQRSFAILDLENDFIERYILY